jgi:hypothetical protein
MGGATGWRRFVPYEVAPLIGAALFTTVIGTYRLFTVSSQPEVRFTKEGGVHNWEDHVKAEPSPPAPKK